MKKLSIIIVNYNSEEFLNACLDSLGDISSEWEVVVFDNGSRDELTIQRSKDPKIQIIQSNKNLGFAKANNQAIAQTNSEYVLLLNPDTIVSRNAITRMVEFMDEKKDCAVATCRVELKTGGIDDASHRGFPTPWNAFCYFSGISSLFPHSTVLNGYHLGYQQMDTSHEIDSCVGAFMMIRSSVGKKLKWLDEDFFWYGEDLDFCYRVKQAGHSVFYVPDVSIIHYKGVSSGIKKHSQSVSKADPETRKRAQDARFDVMRIFYEKHYKNKYPSAIYGLVMTGISAVKFLKTGRI